MMKKATVQRKKNRFVSLFLFWLTLFFCAKGLVLADDVTVSATIPDTQPPSVPILIEPADGALIADNTPSFKWYASVDNVGLSHYIFYLDGSAPYGNLPLIDTDNSTYLLDYDELNSIYTFTPKSGLNDAAHTWKVVAVDYVNLKASSDTWDFSIDTLAPNFVLTKIGDTTVSISASSVASVPSNPIVIFQNDPTANEPLLIAGGEALSSVKLTVTIVGEPTQTYTTKIDSNSHYELKLGILPRDKDIRLDFVITDAVNHVSVLEGVYFRIALQYWPVATATPTPTANPTLIATPTLTPTVLPLLSLTPTTTPSVSLAISVIPTTTASPSMTLTPTLTPALSVVPTGIIPIIPPKEIIHEFGGKVIELLPESTANYVKTFLRSKLWQNLSLVFPLLVLLLFYFLSLLILLSKFIQSFSISLLQKILTLFMAPFFKASKNLVFEYKETLASPLVKVELLDESGQVLDFAITNLEGNFDDLAYPESGRWCLQVKDDNFYYPIGDEKPAQLEFWQFYQKQMIDTNYGGQAILMPTLRAAGQEKLPFLERLRIFILYLLDYPVWFLALALFFTLVFVLRYPSIYNTFVLILYVSLALYKLFISLNKKKISRLIVHVQLLSGQQFNDNLVLSFFDQKKQIARSMVMPFAFSKSKVIKHSFSNTILTVFAKRVALVKNDLVIGSQVLSLSQKEEEITLQIKKI